MRCRQQREFRPNASDQVARAPCYLLPSGPPSARSLLAPYPRVGRFTAKWLVPRRVARTCFVGPRFFPHHNEKPRTSRTGPRYLAGAECEGRKPAEHSKGGRGMRCRQRRGSWPNTSDQLARVPCYLLPSGGPSGRSHLAPYPRVGRHTAK